VVAGYIARRVVGHTIFAPKEALELLNRLAEDWRNEVWLLSGLPVVAGELRNVGIV
jgi:trehalose-6-phosphatase